jgi:hypothetical protein
MIQPKTKGDDLFDEVARYQAGFERSDIALMKLKQKVDNVLRTMPADGNAILAGLMVAIMRKKRAEFDAFVDRLERNPAIASVECALNVVIGLQAFGEFAKARERLASMLAVFPHNPALLEAATLDAVRIGRAHLAFDFHERYVRATGSPSKSFENSGIEPVRDFLDEHGLSDDDAASVIEPFFEVLSGVSDRPFDGRAAWHIISETVDGSPLLNMRISPVLAEDAVSAVIDRYGDLLAERDVSFDTLALINVEISGLAVEQDFLNFTGSSDAVHA